VSDATMIGERRRHLQRTLDDRIVVVVRSVGGFGAGRVRKSQHHVAQLNLHRFEPLGQNLFGFSERSALDLKSIRQLGVAVTPGLTHLLGEFVDGGPNTVAFGGDLTQLFVERDGGIELLQQVGRTAAGQGDPHGLGIVAEQTNVDHRNPRIPVVLRPRPCEIAP